MLRGAPNGRCPARELPARECLLLALVLAGTTIIASVCRAHSVRYVAIYLLSRRGGENYNEDGFSPPISGKAEKYATFCRIEKQRTEETAMLQR